MSWYIRRYVIDLLLFVYTKVEGLLSKREEECNKVVPFPIKTSHIENEKQQGLVTNECLGTYHKPAKGKDRYP